MEGGGGKEARRVRTGLGARSSLLFFVSVMLHEYLTQVRRCVCAKVLSPEGRSPRERGRLDLQVRQRPDAAQFAYFSLTKTGQRD